MTRNIRRVLLSLCFALSLLLVSCGSPEQSTTSESPSTTEVQFVDGGTVTIANASDIISINDLLGQSTPIHAFVQDRLFFSLLEEQPDYQNGPATFAPALASSYEFSEDRKTLTFNLRDDISWSDGQPVTAEDVRWTWQAQTAAEVGWSAGEAKAHITDVEVVDPTTARFHFDKSYSWQLMDAVEGVILPSHVWSQLPFDQWRGNADWFQQNLVVNGPFTLESWEPGQRIILTKNESYSDADKPRVDRVVVRIVPDGIAQLAMLKTGDIDMMDWARPGQLPELEKNPDIELKSYIPRTFISLIWNTALPSLDSAKTRRALTMAIDRQSIIDALYHGYATVPASPFMSNLWATNKDLKPLPYDPEQAVALLAEDGWQDSDGDGVLDRNGEPFRLVLLNGAGNEVRIDAGLMIVEQMRQIGVELEQQVIEFNTMITRERNHDFDVALMGLSIPTNLDMSYFFHTDHIDGSFNFGSFSDPEVDRLLDEIQVTPNLLDAKPLFDELQVGLQQGQPMTFLYEALRVLPVNKRVQGVHPNVLRNFGDPKEWAIVASSP